MLDRKGAIMWDRRKWYSIILIGVVMVLATFSLSCNDGRLDKADDYLKRASLATDHLRGDLAYGREVDVDSELEYIGKLIEWARDEISDIRGFQDPPETHR